jgi:hypothetical protein
VAKAGGFLSSRPASLVYKVSSRTARAIQRNPVSETKKPKKKKKKNKTKPNKTHTDLIHSSTQNLAHHRIFDPTEGTSTFRH